MEIDPRLVKELTEAMAELMPDSRPGSDQVDPAEVVAARLYQVGWRQQHITKAGFPMLSDVAVNKLINYLRDLERGQKTAQAVLTNWRAFVRRVDRIGDFRCPASESSAAN